MQTRPSQASTAILECGDKQCSADPHQPLI
jgi:hypothetical protein